MYSAQQIADALDFAVLRPTATTKDILAACEIVKQNNIRTICVAPVNVRLAVSTGAPVCAVVGFPHGTSTPRQKQGEALELIEYGAIELDVVINYSRLLEGDGELVAQELTEIIRLAKERQIIVKAILETCFYTNQALEEAAHFCIEFGIDFLKTSSGYGLHGATPQAVKILLRAVEGTDVQIKASGGIHCYNDAAKYLDLGCTRLGASRFKELLP